MQTTTTSFFIINLSYQTREPILGLSAENLKNLSDPFVEAYYQKQVDMAVMLGAEKSQAEVEMREALIFESELSKVVSVFQLLHYLLYLH